MKLSQIVKGPKRKYFLMWGQVKLSSGVQICACPDFASTEAKNEKRLKLACVASVPFRQKELRNDFPQIGRAEVGERD